MIFDLKANAERYLGISSNMDTALNWLKRTDLAALPDGRTEIDGDNVFVNVMEAVTKPQQDCRFEFHRDYYDIQVLIRGREDIAFGTDCSRVTTAYQTDIGFCDCPAAVESHLTENCFVICEPQEPHAPCMAAAGSPSPIRKAVIKVHR